MITVKTASDAGLTEEQFQRLYEITVIAYRDTEVEMWGENYIRISEDEYRHVFDKNEILIAFLDDEVVGGVWHRQINEGSYWFGLLSADFSKSGKGIGRALIDRVEELAREKGCTNIRIEILRPRDMEVEKKKIIADWYQRMGYKYIYSEDFAIERPIKAKKLICPSDFDCYQKLL